MVKIDNSGSSLMRMLKRSTKEWHLKLESLPFFKALGSRTLPLESYVQQLRALSVVHAVLENEIARLEEKEVKTVWDDHLRKLPLLQKDIQFFKQRHNSDNKYATEAAQEIVKKIRFRRVDNPVSLLGYLYVFEGSTLGNNMHKPDLVALYSLTGLKGCSFYASYRDKLKDNWKQFSEQMNSAVQDAELIDPIIEAAVEAFSGLEMLYKTLHPLLKTKQHSHISKINPEAGNHPVPDDEREIDAALRASKIVWVNYAYYELRFGERGKRFSDSDMCWLVTLTELSKSDLIEQIDWLCSVLANRGMPAILLEESLYSLNKELIQSIPENKSRYDKLIHAADHLKNRRTRSISEKSFDDLVDKFNNMTGPDLQLKFKNSGKIIISAVCDEKAGESGALSRLMPWMTEKERFPQKWISAVEQIVEEAQKLSK